MYASAGGHELQPSEVNNSTTAGAAGAVAETHSKAPATRHEGKEKGIADRIRRLLEVYAVMVKTGTEGEILHYAAQPYESPWQCVPAMRRTSRAVRL